MADTEKGFVPTNDQKAVFLMALGRQMLKHNLVAGAALDGMSDTDMIEDMQRNGLDGQVAEQILALDHSYLEEAIDANF